MTRGSVDIGSAVPEADRIEGPGDGFDTDVLVVGTGPAGATATLALATYGLHVRAVTRWRWHADSPRAHITNQRAMEVLRDLGVEEDAKRVGTPWAEMGDMTFAASLAGRELARLRTWGTGHQRMSDYLSASPCPLLDVVQPHMESLLTDAAGFRGALISFNTEFLGFEQDGSGVTSELMDRLTGHQYTVRSRYLVGADGANSRVADTLGLPIEGQMGRAGTVYARFSADLTEYVAHRPSILHRILIPAYGEIGLRTLRAIKPWTEWIAGWGYNVESDTPDLSEENALAVIGQMIGASNVSVRIQNVTSWKVNQAWATEYARGRVFCAGDAVHRHPPSSGLGSNTSIQDAFNLAWKLAYVVRGWAKESILATYSHERAPVGRQVVERANQSRVDYGALNNLLRRSELHGGQPAISLMDDPSPEGARMRQALIEAVDVKNFEFNAQGIELNQRYASSAVLADSATEEEWRRDPTLYAQPTTRPGAKVPHAWLVNQHGRKVSTLDAVGHGRFSLVTGLSGRSWVCAVDALRLPYLDTVVIGTPELQDLYGAWHKLSEIHEAGALLVRPDGYVAWRHADAVWDTSAAETLLSNALEALGLLASDVRTRDDHQPGLQDRDTACCARATKGTR